MTYPTILIFILKLIFLFMTGTILGWTLEIFWRRFFGLSRRWTNPGFLNGPWLPIYGFGTIILYFICGIPVDIYTKVVIFLLGLTTLEFVSGLVFVKIYNIRLWDYSNSKWNIKGIICPFYSLLWTLAGIFFNYLIYPFLLGNINRLLIHLELSFFIGLYAGIFVMDLIQSFNLANQLKMILKETNDKLHIDYVKFKLEVRDRFNSKQNNNLKANFLMPFRGLNLLTIRESIQTHRSNLKTKRKNILK